MGLVAIVSSAVSSATAGVSSSASASAGAGAGGAASSATSAISLLSPVGLGVGGVFVAASLIFLLAYLDLYDASESNDPQLRTTLVVTIVPLLLTFGAIVLFKSLQVI